MKIQDFLKTKTLKCFIRGTDEEVAQGITQFFIDNNIPLDTEFEAIESEDAGRQDDGDMYHEIIAIIVDSKVLNKNIQYPAAEVVTPLSAMKQAVEEVLKETMFKIDISTTVELDENKIAETVKRYENIIKERK